MYINRLLWIDHVARMQDNESGANNKTTASGNKISSKTKKPVHGLHPEKIERAKD